MYLFVNSKNLIFKYANYESKFGLPKYNRLPT